MAAHDVHTAYERRWSTLANGQLIEAADAAGFDLLVTTDRNLRYQQNLADRRIAIIVLSTPSWPRIQGGVPRILRAIDQVAAGGLVEVDIG